MMRFWTLLLFSTVSQSALAKLPHLDLRTTLDLPSRTLTVTAIIRVEGGSAPLRFELADAAGVDARQLQFEPLPETQTRRLDYRLPLTPLAKLDHREVLTDQTASADARGSFIPAASLWYPSPSTGAFTYRVQISTAADQRALVPGVLEAESVESDAYRATFRFDAPAQAIDLMAGPYLIEERFVHSPARIRLRTYFHPELKSLAGDYLDSAAGYLSRYAEEIGPYPYTEFSIVSSPTPTGFGMPTLTYLGIEVLRLPFIRHTSLGHEVLHNWWGNGVYVDYAGGNWCEGLTAFMADYAYKAQTGEDAARGARLAWLRDIAALPNAPEHALRGFRARTHGASQIVGYSKAAMLFYMLRERIGQHAFTQGLRHFWANHRFATAGWQHLQASFEQAAPMALGEFFSQWLDRGDIPSLRLISAQAAPGAVRLVIEQSAPPFALQIPIVLKGDGSHTRHLLSTHQTSQRFVLPAPPGAHQVVLDPDLQLLRRLEAAELPPILRQVMVAKRVHLLTTEAFSEGALVLASKLLDESPESGAGKLAPGTPALLIGPPDWIDSQLAQLGMARPAELAVRASSQVWAAKRPDGGDALVVSTADLSSLQALHRPLPHYGAQSYLIFEGSKVVERGLWPHTQITLPVR